MELQVSEFLISHTFQRKHYISTACTGNLLCMTFHGNDLLTLSFYIVFICHSKMPSSRNDLPLENNVKQIIKYEVFKRFPRQPKAASH